MVKVECFVLAVVTGEGFALVDFKHGVNVLELVSCNLLCFDSFVFGSDFRSNFFPEFKG